MAGDLGTKSLAGLNLPPLKGSVFPPKGVCPSNVAFALLFSSGTPNLPQLLAAVLRQLWNHLEPKLCPLLQKLPGRHPARRVGSDVSVVGTLGMFPVAATSWELLCPKPPQPNGQLEPHAAGSWLLPQHQITHENVCVSLTGFGKVC